MFQSNPDSVKRNFKQFKVSLQGKRVRLILGVSQQATGQGSKKKTVNLTKPNICSIFNYNKYITKPASQQIERSETSESRRHSIYHNQQQKHRRSHTKEDKWKPLLDKVQIRWRNTVAKRQIVRNTRTSTGAYQHTFSSTSK